MLLINKHTFEQAVQKGSETRRRDVQAAEHRDSLPQEAIFPEGRQGLIIFTIVLPLLSRVSLTP
jgi:hypothetical protein